jgi:hypothetical protein
LPISPALPPLPPATPAVWLEKPAPPLPYKIPPGRPLGSAAVPLAPLPISGRPISATVDAFTAAEISCSTLCNGEALAASALAYQLPAEFKVCTNSL